MIVVRLNGECPIKYGLRLNSEAKYGELKEQLSDLCRVEPKRLLLAEVASCQVRKKLKIKYKITETNIYILGSFTFT